MEKISANKAQVVLLILFTVTLAWCQPNAGTCNTAAVTQYVQDNLDFNCAISLTPALNTSNSVSMSVRDEALSTICTETCAGKLADWLINNCNSKFNSTSLYYLCLQTGNRATVGRYCQYSIPPLFDADQEISTLFQACGDVQLQCTDQCALQLQNLANQLGCCYQSLYNNTDYLQEAAAIGELAPADVTALQIVGNQMLWSACSVTPPGKCTTESFAFPMTGRNLSVRVLPHLSVLLALLLMVAATLSLPEHNMYCYNSEQL